MQVPSINYVITAAVKTVVRFPLVVACALIGTITAIFAIENMGDELVKQKVMMCASLGLTAFLSFSLWNSYYKVRILYSWLVGLTITAMLACYYWSLGSKISELEGIRFFVLNVSLHLLVSFVLFLNNKHIDDFWNFNKNLFIRVFVSGLYSVTLILGLNFAVLAIDNLFNAEINERIYGEIPVLVLGLFNTLFFLNGIPKNDELNTTLDYPKGLKSFTQFVLVPLVIIYLLILLTYETKILILFDLPKGWVSSLILVFSVLGILAMLLVYPLRNLEENKWIKQLWKWYFILLLPLLGLLYWAIIYRVNTHGITVERYYVLLLAIWLTGLTLYSIFKANYHIKVIPISLALVGLFSLYGPQSASNVSKYSQLGRLKLLLENHEKSPLNFEDKKSITSVVDYIKDNFGAEELNAYFPDAFNKDVDLKSITVQAILESKGIEYVGRYESEKSANADQILQVSASIANELYDLPDANYHWRFEIQDVKNEERTIKGSIENVVTEWKENKLLVHYKNNTLSIDLSKFIKNMKTNRPVYSNDELTFFVQDEECEVTCIIKHLSVNKLLNSASFDLEELEADFYMKIKQ
jgi:hypothetical protein